MIKTKKGDYYLGKIGKKFTWTEILTLFFVIALFFACLLKFNRAHAAITATLTLSPSSFSLAQNQNFAVNIILDTAGNAIDGVDVFSLHFNPAVIQVVDDNVGLTGIQITPGSLLPATVANTADNAAGTIQFSQASSGGTNFTGSGILATIHFRVVSTGSSNVTFDFSPGNTTDTNVAFQGNDLLASVTNGTYTTDITSPTVSLTSPSGGATVSGSVSVTASASDNIGVAGVQFKLDGSNLGLEDTTSPYSVSWDTTASANGSHTLTATARDAAGNTVTSSSVSVTVSNIVNLNRTIQIDPEGRVNKAISDNLDVLNISKSLIKSYAFTTNSSGSAPITFDIASQVVYLKIKTIPFLTRLLSVDLNSTGTYTFPKLLTGDINQDNIINSVDYSALNAKWFMSDPVSDLNKDGIVNSIDFSFMNQHWLVSGDQ